MGGLTMDDIKMSQRLIELENPQLDHLSLGLLNAFGAELAGNHNEPETYSLILENGQLVALDAETLTVQDVWDIATRLTP